MNRYAILDAPSVLGLRPTGVEYLPEALKSAGLAEKLEAQYAGAVFPPKYSPIRDQETKILNPAEIRDYSRLLADSVKLLSENMFPIVLGGDCSILLGNLLALRRLGRYGLFFIDGHADFYQPGASPTGEAADMELALVSGRGPEILSNIDGLRPLVRDEDIVLFGNRDGDEAKTYGSQDVAESGIHVYELKKVHGRGLAPAGSEAMDMLARSELKGVWIHLDVDALDDELMPAVDYRMPGGLTYQDLEQLLKIVMRSRKVVGMDVTIFNPKLDQDGALARKLVFSLVAGLLNE